MKVKIFTDGGSRGNPGPAAAGVVIYNEDDQIIFEKAQFLGVKTNNEAEYEALILSLEWLKKNIKKQNISEMLFFLDSKLVVEQINKNWKVKNPNMKKATEKAWGILEDLALPHSFVHLYREKNQLADALVNQALDKAA